VPRRRRICLVIATLAFGAAFALVAAAATTVQYIPPGTVFGPGSIGHSGWTGKTWLDNSFYNAHGVYGDDPYMGTTFLNTVQPPQPIKPWIWTGADFYFDTREETNYAAAACGAKNSNTTRVYIYYCTADHNS